jgi:histidinol dehydrogenase
VRIERVNWDGEDAASMASRLRERTAAPQSDVAADVARIIADVRERGDEAVRDLTRRFDATEAMPAALQVGESEVQHALEGLDLTLRKALEVAAVNIRAVAEAELDTEETKTRLGQGQEICLADRPVTSAGAYAPGGRAFYPSSVLMTCVPAKVAGVERVVLVSPPGPDGKLGGAVLSAAAIAGVDEIHACGGAQAVAALALGTESIDPVNVIAGPGNAWVTEAKRQLYGTVGIDGLAGPSELVVVCDRSADPLGTALDAMAQAEHGTDSPVLVLSDDAEVLERVAAEVERLAPERPSVPDATLTLVNCPEVNRAVQLADCFAPEHLELRLAGANEALAMERTAGCVFVGAAGATSFGDYAAGSNHVLPTGGAARFSGPLGIRSFLRRTAVVTIPASAASELAPTVASIAEAEGFPVHGESATARASAPETVDVQVD